MGSDRTDESDRRAFEAAIRNAALEEAARLASGFHWTLPMYEDAAINEATDDAACAVQEQIAAAIRALKSDPAPVPAAKPFTFADPTRQAEHERHRAESKGREGE